MPLPTVPSSSLSISPFLPHARGLHHRCCLCPFSTSHPLPDPPTLRPSLLLSAHTGAASARNATPKNRTSDPGPGGARADPASRSGGDGCSSARRDRPAARRGSCSASKNGDGRGQPFAGLSLLWCVCVCVCVCVLFFSSRISLSIPKHPRWCGVVWCGVVCFATCLLKKSGWFPRNRGPQDDERRWYPYSLC